jgi:hypothetical protein
MAEDRGSGLPDPGLPFPDSLCHVCAAPVRYVRNDRGSVFLFCPLFRRYPPQPVLRCDRFVRLEKEAPPPDQ